MLPFLSYHLHNTSCRHTVLYKQMGQLRRFFQLDVLPVKQWGRVNINKYSQFDCIGPSTVFRISLSFLCFFGCLLIFMLCHNTFSMSINEGFFCLKYLFVLGVFIAFLFAPNESFNRYAIASQYISIAFMAIQVLIFL